MIDPHPALPTMNSFGTWTMPRALWSNAGTSTVIANGRDQTAPSDNILVVDDDREIRDILVFMLNHAGYEVDAADDGEAGWDALCAKPYDLLITDHTMPKLTGLDLLRRLRGDARTTPCIMVSGDIPWHEPDLPSLLEPGAIVAKPFSFSTLLAKVKELIRVESPA